MTDQQRSDWLPVEEMAPLLGVSVSTLKRRITQWVRDGKPVDLPGGRSVEIEAEQVNRPQGHFWQVRVKGDLPPISTDQTADDSKQPPALTSAQGAAQGATLALETITGLVERNAALSDRVAALERVAGRADLLAEQLDAERQKTADLAERLRLAEEKAARPWWKRW